MKTKTTFFGKMDYESFKLMDDREKFDYLRDNGWYQINVSKENQNAQFKPSSELVEQFYSFVLKEFYQKIEKNISTFFVSFNDMIFGLTKQESKRMALDAFNDIYKELNPQGIAFTSKTKSKSGTEIIETSNRTMVLLGLQTALKNKLATNDALMAFLAGDKSYMHKMGYFDSELIKRVIEFESKLKILLQLNDQYGFEEDRIFTNIRKYHRLYSEKYHKVFNCFEVFSAVYELLENQKDSFSSFNDSLYKVLDDNGWVKRSKLEYVKFLKTEFNSAKRDIKIYDQGENLEHDKRVELIEQHFRELTLLK